ncbi:ribostamycin [Paenibacillus chitinolyticus]|uniref:BtrH N-terminal domain-containing protein n=1 Tax=Paenibacillus chitinolyticus TaxID=79263 RepID=A0A410WYX5_9BACL|nr:BtrH N-terminal domain-containing protein [Paenibacillus chitinolyticus]MCY9590465.1 BtrH N-terminal domain-containing protein [Paenibacillus chitinolyticus]MCY9596540.1 BtrH N-terminal domain-containing protein [Paenibacillus chitinolyticus]QAV19550.1 ribostamycin [Paenibacillus chitinolyticus]
MCLTRYDEKFFDCRKSQIIAYLDSNRVPVIPLFYNSYQSTAEIYRQIFIENKSKWKYSEPSFSDDDLLRKGITPVRASFPDFSQASDCLKELLARRKLVFVWGDEYYLPYRKEAFHVIHSTHSFVVTDYDGENKAYYVEDWDGLYGYLPAAHVEAAFDSLSGQMRTLLVLELNDEEMRENKQEDLALFRQWLQAFEDDYIFYDRVLLEMRDYEENRLISMDHGLRLIAASRHVFSKFLHYIDDAPEEADLLIRNHQLANHIATIVRRYMIARQIDWDGAASKIRQLREQEADFMRKLKRRYA